MGSGKATRDTSDDVDRSLLGIRRFSAPVIQRLARFGAVQRPCVTADYGASRYRVAVCIERRWAIPSQGE